MNLFQVHFGQHCIEKRGTVDLYQMQKLSEKFGTKHIRTKYFWTFLTEFRTLLHKFRTTTIWYIQCLFIYLLVVLYKKLRKCFNWADRALIELFKGFLVRNFHTFLVLLWMMRVIAKMDLVSQNIMFSHWWHSRHFPFVSKILRFEKNVSRWFFSSDEVSDSKYFWLQKIPIFKFSDVEMYEIFCV